MGGPSSSVVAELYMLKHDNRALTKFKNSPRKVYECQCLHHKTWILWTISQSHECFTPEISVNYGGGKW